MLSVTGTVNSTSVNEQYGYDLLQRLTSTVLQSGSSGTTLSYGYDSVGNRISQTLNGVTTSYSYNATNNELKSSSTMGTSISYSYDLNGNLASKTVNTSPAFVYAWDAANRLIKVTSGSVLQGAYAYDGMGRRVESVEATTTLYAYSGTESLYELVPGVSSSDFIYVTGMRIVRVSGTTTNYYHTDALGSTRLVTDGSKKILFSDNYQPYGQDNLSSGSETYEFTGKPYSSATGLYYDYQRWYDPSIGRFISPDSLAGFLSDPLSLNGYVYGSDAPTTATDPTGMNAVYLHTRSCPTLWQNFFGSLQCSLSAIVVGPDLVIDPTVSGLGDTDPTITPPREPTTPTTSPGPSTTTGPNTITLPSSTTPTISEDLGASISNVARGNLGVEASIQDLGENYVGSEVPVSSEIYGNGRIDIYSTGPKAFVESKNVQNLYLTQANKLQLWKYVDAVGAESLQYDLHMNFVHPDFIAELNRLNVAYRILPYIPYL